MSGRDVADECWPGKNIEADAVDMMSPSSRRKRTMVELVLSFLNTAAPAAGSAVASGDASRVEMFLCEVVDNSPFGFSFRLRLGKVSKFAANIHVFITLGL